MNSKKKIQTKSDILNFFYNASTPKKELLIGLEVERSAVFDNDLSPVQYSGTSGYLAILKKMVEEVGWKIISQDENGNITALKRGRSEIHVEDDGRLELVSKARKGLYSLCREYQMHTREIDERNLGFPGYLWGNNHLQQKKKLIIFSLKKLKIVIIITESIILIGRKKCLLVGKRKLIVFM